MNKVSLVVFTCVGREYLLQKSFKSFIENCDFKFDKIIFAIDGKIDLSVIPLIDPDVVVQSVNRKGYVNNMIQATKLVETPYFFWLEDDFLFNQKVPLDYMLRTLELQEKWAGIFLSRTAPFTEVEKKIHHFENFYLPEFGYSASPTLCRTEHAKAALKALIEFPKNDDTKFIGFEPFMNDYFIANDISYALIDPCSSISHVTHIGQLENTGREYQMINSIDKDNSLIGKKYLSNFGKDKKITAYNKLAMLPKLWFSVLVLSFKLIKFRSAYDIAFRIYISYLRGFKY